MTREQQLEDALQWIRRIARKNHDLDETLRSRGARTLRRIVIKADEVLGKDYQPLPAP